MKKFKVVMRDGSEHVIEAAKHRSSGMGTIFVDETGGDVAMFADGTVSFVVPVKETENE